jgi:sporulation protein YtfJ
MENHPIQDIVTDAVEKIHDLVDSNTVIGERIKTDSGITILPITKITFGFVSGGSDFATEKQKDLFGGAASTGASITPVGFLVINGTSVKLIQMAEGGAAFDRVLNMVPDVMDRVDGLISSKGKKEIKGKVSSKDDEAKNIVKDTENVSEKPENL